jgi:HAD superfamily hydrolase (TIGR01509 family)
MGTLSRQPGRGQGGTVTLRALLFDIDGTLVDSDPIHIDVFLEFLAVRGVTITEADYMERIHGRRNIETFPEFLPHEDPREMDLAKEAAYRERLGDQVEPLPGARDLIIRAKAAGLRIGAVTNGPRANLNAVLNGTGLADLFDHTGSSDDVTYGKPHPELYLAALAALNITAEEAIVFEDSPIGIQSARAAGLDVVGMATSLSAETLVGHGVLFAITDFTDPALARHLSCLEGAPA